MFLLISCFFTALHNLPRFGQLKDITKFDASFFNVPPSMANRMDPGLRMLHEVTYEAIVDAGTFVYRFPLSDMYKRCPVKQITVLKCQGLGYHRESNHCAKSQLIY